MKSMDSYYSINRRDEPTALYQIPPSRARSLAVTCVDVRTGARWGRKVRGRQKSINCHY